MINRFHLAIEAGDLTITVPWYQEVLGCELDMAEKGFWQDVDFWGNELTLHQNHYLEKRRVQRDIDMMLIWSMYVFLTLVFI